MRSIFSPDAAALLAAVAWATSVSTVVLNAPKLRRPATNGVTAAVVDAALVGTTTPVVLEIIRLGGGSFSGANTEENEEGRTIEEEEKGEMAEEEDRKEDEAAPPKEAPGDDCGDADGDGVGAVHCCSCATFVSSFSSLFLIAPSPALCMNFMPITFDDRLVFASPDAGGLINGVRAAVDILLLGRYFFAARALMVDDSNRVEEMATTDYIASAALTDD